MIRFGAIVRGDCRSLEVTQVEDHAEDPSPCWNTGNHLADHS